MDAKEVLDLITGGLLVVAVLLLIVSTYRRLWGPVVVLSREEADELGEIDNRVTVIVGHGLGAEAWFADGDEIVAHPSLHVWMPGSTGLMLQPEFSTRRGPVESHHVEFATALAEATEAYRAEVERLYTLEAFEADDATEAASAA